MKRWNILASYDGLRTLLNKLLANRGISDDSLSEFINPLPLNDYFSALPVEFKQSLKDASILIKAAITENDPILIHGDYDSDGICATAILYNTIKKELQYNNVFCFIPNRFDHGYGLSTGSVDASISLVKETIPHAKSILFITVDSGITSVNEAAYVKSLGHKIIITDHHQKPSNPPAPDCLVWYDQVVGAGISWILSKVIGSKSTQSIAFAALATVTDLQPVLGFNRSIVKRGLEVINSDPPMGIRKLLDVAGKKETEVTSYALGWVLGPRLNASGRLIDAKDSLRLFIENDSNTVTELAEKLNKINMDRQDKTFEMYGIASNIASDIKPKIVIAADENYHEGIIGLVAAKIVQKYYCPAIVISLKEDMGKGSVRSVPGIDIISFLRQHEDMFESLGGHPMAAGFTIKKDKIPELTGLLTKDAESFSDDLLVPVLDIDIEIPLQDLSMEIYEEIQKLKPFGLGNEEPVFVTKNAGVLECNLIGRDQQHVSLKLYKNDGFVKALYFNATEEVKRLKMGDKIDLVYTLNKNEFNGKISLDLFVKDIKPI